MRWKNPRTSRVMADGVLTSKPPSSEPLPPFEPYPGRKAAVPVCSAQLNEVGARSVPPVARSPSSTHSVDLPSSLLTAADFKKSVVRVQVLSKDHSCHFPISGC